MSRMSFMSKSRPLVTDISNVMRGVAMDTEASIDTYEWSLRYMMLSCCRYREMIGNTASTELSMSA